jgi:uncharacterized protein YggL (DUF469 family)
MCSLLNVKCNCASTKTQFARLTYRKPLTYREFSNVGFQIYVGFFKQMRSEMRADEILRRFIRSNILGDFSSKRLHLFRQPVMKADTIF